MRWVYSGGVVALWQAMRGCALSGASQDRETSNYPVQVLFLPTAWRINYSFHFLVYGKYVELVTPMTAIFFSRQTL